MRAPVGPSGTFKFAAADDFHQAYLVHLLEFRANHLIRELEERLVERYNSDLANSLGNLLNRTLNMAHRYRQGVVTRTGGDSPLAVQTADLLHGYRSAFSRLEVHAAMKRLMEFATTCNTYIEMNAPWKLAKDPSRAEALDHVLSVLAESLRVIGVLISPVLPRSSREIFYQLNVHNERQLSDPNWGGLLEKHHLGKPTPLFPRIEMAQL